jgi:hypothetical protein
MGMNTVVLSINEFVPEKGYFVDNEENFWGLLFRVGITKRKYLSQDYGMFTLRHGIGFFDILHLPERVNIEPDFSINEEGWATMNEDFCSQSMAQFLAFLRSHRPKRVLFDGRQAAELFMQFVANNRVLKVNEFLSLDKNVPYEMIDKWQGIELYIMPKVLPVSDSNWEQYEHGRLWTEMWKFIVKDRKKSSSKEQSHWKSAFYVFLFCLLFLFLIWYNKN